MRTPAALLRGLFLFGALLGASAAWAGPLTFQTTDGVAIHATEYGTGKQGVVLVHDRGRSQADWSYFAGRLADRGLRVVAVDLRGHGISKPPETPAAEDYPKMTADIAAAVSYLKTKGVTEVTLIGAGLGANLAVNTAADQPLVTSVVLLSPGLNINGVTMSASLERYGQRPMLLVASVEDAYAIKTVNFLDEKAAGSVSVEVLEDAGSGLKMLSRDATLEGKLFAWLNGTYSLKAERSSSPQFQTGDTTSLRTTGVKFGEGQ